MAANWRPRLRCGRCKDYLPRASFSPLLEGARKRDEYCIPCRAAVELRRELGEEDRAEIERRIAEVRAEKRAQMTGSWRVPNARITN